MKNFFKKELQRGQRLSLNDVALRVMAATKMSRGIVCKFSTQEDVDQYARDMNNSLKRDMIVLAECLPAIRKAIQHLIVDMKKNPTVDKIVEILRSVISRECLPEMVTWLCSRVSLY